MNNNILKKLFDSLKIIFNKQQKRSALNLFFIMVIGMILEILLLNNLFILLNYLSNTNLEVPEIIKYISDIGKIIILP